MTTTKVEINVPTEMTIYLADTDQGSELTRNALMLYPYIRNLTISHGRAAEILGIRKMDLIDLYANLGIPYFDMDISEVEADMKAYESLA